MCWWYFNVSRCDQHGCVGYWYVPTGHTGLANGINVTGIVTVGLSTIKSGEIDVLGVVTATTFKAGAAISITDSAISATRFHGSGADLTGITVGLS